jgi:hypothetical protein
MWKLPGDWSKISALALFAIERAAEPGAAAMPPFKGVEFDGGSASLALLLSISVELAITAGAGGVATAAMGTLSNVNREAVALIGELEANALTFTEFAGEFDPESSSSTTSFNIPLSNESPVSLLSPVGGVLREK